MPFRLFCLHLIAFVIMPEASRKHPAGAEVAPSDHARKLPFYCTFLALQLPFFFLLPAF